MSDITLKWVKVLLPFTAGYNLKLTEIQLARSSNTPQQTASRQLNILASQNLVDYTSQGRNKLFYLDFSKLTTHTLIQTLECHKSLEFQQKVREASLIIGELLNHSQGIILFGSYASKKFDKQSDLDIVILGKADKNRIKEMKRGFSIQLNEHYATYNEFAMSLKTRNPLSLEILNNHILFGDISSIVRSMIEAVS